VGNSQISSNGSVTVTLGVDAAQYKVLVGLYMCPSQHKSYDTLNGTGVFKDLSYSYTAGILPMVTIDLNKCRVRTDGCRHENKSLFYWKLRIS